MTEFSFYFFIPPNLYNCFLSFLNKMPCHTGKFGYLQDVQQGCVHGIHFRNDLHGSQFESLIMGFLLKYKKENGGFGARSPENFLLAMPLRLLENAFSASSSNC